VISFALAAKMYYDLLKEMPLAGAVIKTTKKHFLPALTAGVVGGLWLLNAAWAFMVGKFAALASTVGYGMIGLGVATFNPFLIGGGLILNAPQIAAFSKMLGSQISTLAGNFSSAVGSYLSGNLSATTTLVAGGTLGAVAITQMILQQNLTSAFMLPPFDETNALLAEVADYACADDDGNPYEIPPGLGGRWPMGEGIVLNGVGAITNDGYVHKNAVDIISDEGVEVRATHTGTIGKVQYKDLTPKKGTGINVDIDYRDASGRRIYTTRYSHLLSVGLNPNTQLQWAVRDQINEGDLVGWVGNTGNSSQAHLHYEILNQIVTYNKVGVGCTLPGLSDKQKEDINNGCDASGGTLLCNFQVP
jgi:murein DD-endopeptidase MepM/ murein hydrolase activator NlpD